MASRIVLALCASLLLVQSISAQCLRAPAYSCGCNAAPIGCGSGYNNIVAPGVASSSGGGFGVSVSSALAPSGVDVQSNNDITGTLSAAGDLPVLAAVQVNGDLPTSGSAATSYSCGNGQVGLTADSLAAAGLSNSATGAGYASAGRAFGLGGYGLGLGGCGCAAPIARPCGC